jgi:heavy metal sensor kinase
MSSENLEPRFFGLSTLRGRLFAWNTLTILLLTITMLVGLREGVSYSVLREEDQLLREDADEVLLIVQRSTPPNWEHVQEVLNRKATGHAPRQWYCQIFTENNVLLVQTERVPEQLSLDLALLNTPITQDDFRITQQPFTVEHENIVIRVGSSLNGVRDDMNRITEVVLVAGFIILIIAPVGGYLLANRAIRPISKIIETTARLRPSQLSERLPLQQTNDELDQLSRTINGLLDRIADYLAHHRTLMANAAHELRSPLAAMRSTSEVALHHERTSDEYKEFLGSVIEECDRLGTLVQHLLLLAESDANRLERQSTPVELHRIVQRSVDMFEGVAESRGVTLLAEVTPVVVHGDAGYLRQVVMNLLDNAIKFAPGGQVRIALSTTGTDAIITVADTGKGIATDDLPKVFERFYRTEKARTRGEGGGSGLGLSICQALVAAHGGRIQIESRLGQGTVVQVNLPLPKVERSE